MNKIQVLLLYGYSSVTDVARCVVGSSHYTAGLSRDGRYLATVIPLIRISYVVVMETDAATMSKTHVSHADCMAVIAIAVWLGTKGRCTE